MQPSTNAYGFSLIVTTRWGNRSDNLARLFTSLQQGMGSPYEVILIVQSEANLEIEIVRSTLPFISDLTIQIIPLCSLSRARNVGARLARFNLLGFPDDDCWYSAGLLHELQNCFERSAASALCTAVVDPIRNLSYGKRPLDVTCRVDWWNAFRLPISVGLFVKRTALIASGLDPAGSIFDECLGAGTRWGCGEETDLICRLLQSKHAIEYDGNLRVFHEVTPYQPTDVPKFLAYGRGFGATVAKWLVAGEHRPLATFLDSQARSFAGTIWSTLRGNATSRKTYWNRGIGSIAGFFEGYCHYRGERDLC